MSDLPSALGIEAVELVVEGGRSVTVRVTGRWRRRRPEARGQAMLVVETGTVRQRFVAMPEPPSLIGAAPGTWRLSFTVPAELAPQLAGKTFLQLGAMMVPLPVGEVVEATGAVEGPRPELLEPPGPELLEPPGPELLEPPGPELLEPPGPELLEPPGPELLEPPGPELIEARELRSSELAAESARRRAAEAEAAVAELNAHAAQLEDELARAREESDRLRDEIAERERRLRSSEQHVHAERARRTEVEQALTHKTRAARHDLRVLHEHVADLERELGRLRRAVDEAQHLAAAAEAGRAAAERRLAQRPPPAPEHRPVQSPPRVDVARAARIAAEFELAVAAGRAVVPLGQRLPPPRAADRTGLRLEAAMVADRASGLKRELDDARRELADTRRELERQTLLVERAYDAIDTVRGELSRLGGDLGARPRPSAPEPPEPVQAEKLNAALARLREATPQPPEDARPKPSAPSAEQPARPVKPWLGKAFRTLVGRDAASAGRLLLALLPAQRAADPHPVAYDLVLGDLATARVTVSSATEQVDLSDAPRPPFEVDFQLVGDLASIARLLAAGRIRRRLGRLPLGGRLARVRGDRARLGALEHLLDAPLTLGQLRAAGVRLDPLLALTLAAVMIEPDWTAGERFTIAHRELPAPAPDAYLHVRGANAPLAGAEPPHGPVATQILCPADDLLAVLAGAPGTAFQLAGEERRLTLVRQWLDRAQCG